MDEMTPTETAAILRQLHDWLRGGTQWAPTMGAEAVKTAIEMIERLEAAEKERDNANAAAAGVALHAGAMQDRLEAAEKSDAESLAMYRRLCDERDALRTENAALVDDMNLLRNNNMTLRAKIEAMEQQEPVWFIDERGEPKRYHKSKADYCKYGGLDLLYALPGAQAQPAPEAKP